MHGTGRRYASLEEIEEDVRRFESAAFTAAEMDHARHVVVAVRHLEGSDFDGALEAMRRDLRRFLAAHGAPKAYNETITVFYMRLLAKFFAETHALSRLDRFNLAVSRFGTMAHVLSFYSRERLFSAAAREAFVEPDLEPPSCDSAPDPSALR